MTDAVFNKKVREWVEAALAQSAKTGALVSPQAFDRGVAFGATFVASRIIESINLLEKDANKAIKLAAKGRKPC